MREKESKEREKGFKAAFGGNSSSRSSTALRSPTFLGTGINSSFGGYVGAGSASNIGNTSHVSDKDGHPAFNKEKAESDFLSNTAHLSALELRNRLELCFVYFSVLLWFFH